MAYIPQPIPYDGRDVAEWMSEKPEDLFWLAARNGYFVHRPMAIGQVILPHAPQQLPEWPHKTPVFMYKFQPIPKEIISQTLDFFRRIWLKNKSEAEILLTYNEQENKIGIFVPPQRCGPGSVNSAFNPEHLQRGWQLIGSIHSHCNFGAGHSGTDLGDAAEFDGIHITIGHVDTDKPSFATMVMVAKHRVDYKIEEIADTSDLFCEKAPEWWDRYVLANDDKTSEIAKTWELFRPPPKPVQKYPAVPWSGNNRYPSQHHGGFQRSGNWVIDYERVNPAHGMMNECGCDNWDEHVPQRFIGAYRTNSNDTRFDPNRATGPVKPVSKVKPVKAANVKRHRGGDFSMDLIRLINDFHENVDDLAALGVFPGDLLDTSDLMRAEDIPYFLEELGIDPTAVLDDDELEMLTEEAPRPTSFPISPDPLQIPGQIKMDDYLLPTDGEPR